MVPPRKGDDLSGSDGLDRSPDGDESASPSADLSSGTKRVSHGGDDFARRLRDVLSGESDDREAAVLPWLQALDLQVPGACRADERSKPLLKLNASGRPAEERLLAQLSQHFETSEVGMLARCLCVPLVSVRVGKIMKQGNILCPIDKRSHIKVFNMWINNFNFKTRIFRWGSFNKISNNNQINFNNHINNNKDFNNPTTIFSPNFIILNLNSTIFIKHSFNLQTKIFHSPMEVSNSP